MKILIRINLLATMSLLLVLSSVNADVFDYTSLFYSFSREGVPDFDQVRASDLDNNILGLPNEGMMYCVPSASMNWMAYIAEHGYSNVPPGVGYWQGSPPNYTSEYNYITVATYVMGMDMQTDPYLGTGGTVKAAVQAQLDSAAPGQFSVYEVYADGNWAPRIKDAAQASISGALVNVNIGWYTEAIFPDSPRELVGGHMVSLVAADGLFSTISVNDPWTQVGILFTKTTQSPFKADQSSFDPVSGTYCYKDGFGFMVCDQRTQDQLNYVYSGYMFGYVAVFPKYGLTYFNDEIIYLNPNVISGLLSPGFQRYTPFPGNRILDLAINPIRIQHPYIVEGSNAIWMLDSMLGTSTEFATVENPKHLTYGGKKEHLYVLSSSAITILDREGRHINEVLLNVPLDTFAFDEKNQRLIGLSRETKELFVFTPELERQSIISVDRDVVGEEGNLFMSINPNTGEAGIFYEGASYYSLIEIVESQVSRQRQIALPSDIMAAESFYLDEYGTAFVSDRGTIVPFDLESRILDASPFKGLPGGQAIQIHRSFSNFDSATMPQIRNMTPEEAERLR